VDGVVVGDGVAVGDEVVDGDGDGDGVDEVSSPPLIITNAAMLIEIHTNTTPTIIRIIFVSIYNITNIIFFRYLNKNIIFIYINTR
jgi:hypothetical protein